MSSHVNNLPRIPYTIPHTDIPMSYWCISPNNDSERIDRQNFNDLVRTVDAPGKYVYIDIEGGNVYFFIAPNEAQQLINQYYCTERNRERIRARRSGHWCAYMRTKKCDGWKKDESGHCRCDVCPFAETRVLSLDAPFGNADTDDSSTFADHTADANAVTEAHLDIQADFELLRTALSKLTDRDRAFLLTRFTDGMNLRTLGELFDIADPAYAGKKASRLVERLRKIIDAEGK